MNQTHTGKLHVQVHGAVWFTQKLDANFPRSRSPNFTDKHLTESQILDKRGFVALLSDVSRIVQLLTSEATTELSLICLSRSLDSRGFESRGSLFRRSSGTRHFNQSNSI